MSEKWPHAALWCQGQRFDVGPCRICSAPGAFGFGEPGPRKDRRKHGYVWACYAHRADVERQWQAAFGPDRPRDAPAQPLPEGGSAVSGGAQSPEQGRLI